MLEGNKILLRIVEPNDATLLFLWENKPENKKVTNVDRPIDLFFIRKLIDSQRDIYLDNNILGDLENINQYHKNSDNYNSNGDVQNHIGFGLRMI